MSTAINVSVTSGLLFNCFDNLKTAHHFSPFKLRWVFSNSSNFSRKHHHHLHHHGFSVRKLNCVQCQTIQTEELQKRKCSPLLEQEILSNGVLLGSNEWKAVPDIWRTAADKYGDRRALVDKYHEPPLELTYKQLEQEILDFAEGLRFVGVKPDEKVALFADNSCRWLIADQGAMAMGAINVVRGSRSSTEELLQIYKHSESVALFVDSPQLFNRMADLFVPQTTMKFIVLLWGEKSDLDSEVCDKFQVLNFNEIVEIGRESRKLLVASDDASKGIHMFMSP